MLFMFIVSTYAYNRIMKKQTVDVEQLIGFVMNKPKEGEMAKVLQSCIITASDPRFYMYINQIDNSFLTPAGISGDLTTNFFIVMHPDAKADIYTDYDSVHIEMSLKDTTKTIKKGSLVYAQDVGSIRQYKVDGIDFNEHDSIVCVIKLGWRYGLLFDFTRKASETNIWHKLGSLYNDLHTDRLIENIRYKLAESGKPHIITEGKTDWKHIEAARIKLSPDLQLSYPSSEDTLGDTGLLKMCDNLSKFGPRNGNKIIAIFDRDNPRIMEKLGEKGDLSTYQYWGNNIYSIVLPIPNFREDYKNISIEMLYSEGDLATKDIDGRRLYFDNELRKEIMPDKTICADSTPRINRV